MKTTKHTYIKLVTIACILITCFTTCKKYPDNILWFKNPENLAPFNGYIKAYLVNGIDSTESLKNYLGSKFYVAAQYGATYDRIAVTESDAKNANRHQPYLKYYAYSTSQAEFSYKYLSKKKQLIINNNIRDTSLYKKNLFIEDGLTWDIIQLSRKNKKDFKIKTTHNNNTYEIHIGN